MDEFDGFMEEIHREEDYVNEQLWKRLDKVMLSYKTMQKEAPLDELKKQQRLFRNQMKYLQEAHKEHFDVIRKPKFN